MTDTFDLQPTLEGERVIIRPVAASDWESMYAAASDPKIWEQHPASDRYTEAAFRFVDTVVFWVGEENIRSRRAMEKIGGVLRAGVHKRDLSGDDPYVIYEIRKDAPSP